MISLDLAVNAIVSGLLLGGFYAAVTVGVTISFGMLDIVNIAHPAFIMLGSFVAYIVNSTFGTDPILIGVVMAPVFFLVGMAVYQIYYYAFEQGGEESIQGLAFFDAGPRDQRAVPGSARPRRQTTGRRDQQLRPPAVGIGRRGS
jgi:branched-chain amino acid transport system permease protein